MNDVIDTPRPQRWGGPIAMIGLYAYRLNMAANLERCDRADYPRGPWIPAPPPDTMPDTLEAQRAEIALRVLHGDTGAAAPNLAPTIITPGTDVT